MDEFKVGDRVHLKGFLRTPLMLVLHVVFARSISPEPVDGDRVTVFWLDEIGRPHKETLPALALEHTDG